MAAARLFEGLCPHFEDHTESPEGYIQWHAWAETMGKTHRQEKCAGCGKYAIWIPKKSALSQEQGASGEVAKCGCDPYADKVIAALEESGALTPAAATIPEGWKLVPCEPTMEMCHAAMQTSRMSDPVLLPSCKELSVSSVIWSAMLAASPIPPATIPGGEREAECERCRLDGLFHIGPCTLTSTGEASDEVLADAGGACDCAARFYGDDPNAHQLCCATFAANPVPVDAGGALGAVDDLAAELRAFACNMRRDDSDARGGDLRFYYEAIEAFANQFQALAHTAPVAGSSDNG